MKKVYATVLLTAVIITMFANTAIPLSYANEAEGSDNVFFFKNHNYVFKSKLSDIPLSFDATVCLSDDSFSNNSVIFGNYVCDNEPYLNFGISSGSPALWFTDISNRNRSIVFSNAKIKKDISTQVSIIYDSENSKYLCYIDGVLKSSVNGHAPNSEILDFMFVIGDDRVNGNKNFFNGALSSFTLFRSTLNKNEIQQNSNISHENIIVKYNFTEKLGQKEIYDLSGNGYTLHYCENWFSEYENDFNYAYSFAVVGDTQIVTSNAAHALSTIYSWILNNKSEKKIAHVFGLGDITHNDSLTEWKIAKRAVQKLNGQIPYSLVRGNHDSIENFTNTFDSENYRAQFDGFYKGIQNSYKLFSVEKNKYLFLTLDYGASDDVLKWAGDIIDSYPQHKVIVTTHAYLYKDGTTLDKNDACPPSSNGGYNNGNDMWDKLFSQHENIILVISGHDTYDEIVMTTSEGIHGNTVTQLLIDPQGVDGTAGISGLVAMLYFSEDGNRISVEYYSTVKEKYFKTSNQFETVLIEESAIEVDAHFTDVPDEPPTRTSLFDIIVPTSLIICTVTIFIVLLRKNKKLI